MSQAKTASQVMSVKKPAVKKSAAKTPKKQSRSEPFAVIPLKELAVFPRMILPLFMARPASLRALDGAMETGSQVVLLTQMNAQHAYPEPQELPKIGVLANVLQSLRLPDGSTRVMVECRQRVRLTRWLHSDPYLKARFISIDETEATPTAEQKVLIELMMRQFEHYMQQSQQHVPEMVEHVPALEDPGALADMIAAYLNASVIEKQTILETLDPFARLEAAGRLLSRSMELQSIENEIHGKIRQSIDQHQKEFFLREKLRAIREELGEESENELESYRLKIHKLPLEEARTKANRELLRLEKLPAMSSESGVIRTYLDTVLDLPWESDKVEVPPLADASDLLDREHFGLDKVKDRILEYLAVQQLTGKPPKTVLCLSGPPGVGKTSLARAIAEATGRKFERIALGGVGDDAEIRGHRRTYIGALPGRLLQALQRAKTTHTVILLDELDKLTKRFSGDPASALLEVLDPEQNNAFRDHYLELPFDLSQVMFVCAANVLHTIPKPLLDRLQVVRLSGYTLSEKMEIARRHLIPKQAEESGMKGESVTITRQGLEDLIQFYTREAGVRELERQLGQLFRFLARKKIEAKKFTKRYSQADQFTEALGPLRYRDLEALRQNQIGHVNGLAWTQTGGSVLPIEVARTPGKGRLRTTGNLGDVMKESMQLALACLRQQAEALGLDQDLMLASDFHAHAPEGAIPKDGPSAGIAIASALASTISQRPARYDVAMTGEITLLGRVLPIGGLKEKLLAAFREQHHTVIIPEANRSDLAEIPAEILEKMTVIPVSHIREVLEIVLEPVKKTQPTAKNSVAKKQTPKASPAKKATGNKKSA